MADATQPENYSADNDPCPICLCSFDRVDVSELQFPFRGPDRRRGFASERYGGQYRYSYACHIRIITRTGGRNDEKRMKKKKKKTFRNSPSKYSRLYRIVRSNTNTCAHTLSMGFKRLVRFLLWRCHIVTTKRGSIKIVPGFRWHAYSFYPRVSFDYVSFRTTRSVCVDTPLDLRAVVCSCKIVVQARVVTNTRCVVELPNISRTRQKGPFIYFLFSLVSLFLFSLPWFVPPTSTCPPFCRVWVKFCFIVIGNSMIEGFITIFLVHFYN